MKPIKKNSGSKGQIRIIGGAHRRQLIQVLPHEGLRPSADRVRETVFNWMMHQWGGFFANKRILDSFAGTGAFGLECVSRGANEVLFVDNHAPAIAAIKQVLHRWQVPSSVEARQADILSVCEELKRARRTFDWIILDPPFGHSWLKKVLPAIIPLTHEHTWLYVELEVGCDVSILVAHGWRMIREGKTQQVTYGLWAHD